MESKLKSEGEILQQRFNGKRTKALGLLLYIVLNGKQTKARRADITLAKRMKPKPTP